MILKGGGRLHIERRMYQMAAQKRSWKDCDRAADCSEELEMGWYYFGIASGVFGIGIGASQRNIPCLSLSEFSWPISLLIIETWM